MSDIIKDGGAAFPHDGFAISGHESLSRPSNGMSLRDWFAGMALPMSAADDNIYGTTIELSERINQPLPVTMAKMAYEIADAMLAEREK